MASEHKKTYLYLWLLLAVALAVVCAFSFFDSLKIGEWEPQKGTFADVILADEPPGYSPQKALEMEEEKKLASQQYERKVVAETDTTVRSVLIFGDSMTILVANRMAAYGEKNGYKVVSVTWDGSSILSWSACDTLDNFIARYHPDFIMVTLGSNELFLKNFDLRKPHVEKLVAKMRNIPFVWIGPPNWKEDVGFNAMMRKTLPQGTFYDSNPLDLPRGKDHIHPTPSGGITWTDSIMSWMPYSPHPIPSVKPDPGVRTRMHTAHYYKANGGKGKAAASEATVASEPSAEEVAVQQSTPEPAVAAPAPAPAPAETHSAPEQPATPE